MRMQHFALALVCALGCSSAPEKKILRDKDYKLWQKDLEERIKREGEEPNLVAQLGEIALINEDFETALKTTRIQIKQAPVAPKALLLREIEILRYAWKLDESLAKLDAFVKTYPRDKESPLLLKRRPVIEKSKVLPPPLKISPYAKNPLPGFNYVQFMQAPEVVYLDGPEKEIFAETKTHAAIDQDIWLKPLGKTPQISWDKGDDGEIHHFPEAHAESAKSIETPGYVQNLGGALTFYGADLSAVSLEFLQKRGCGLPALSPWSDFMVASCVTADHRDLVIFVRSGNEWKEIPIGDGINTPFDETAPRISADGRYLFFASDGHPGYGAFDYFYTPISYSKEGVLQFGKAVNFGPQVNTFHNEVYPLQLSHLNDGIIFSAEGKDGLIGKVSSGGLPKVQRTYSCRFIAYGENGAVPQALTLTPVKGDARPAQTLNAGEKSAWIRLLTAAEYRVSFRTPQGADLTFTVNAPSAKDTNYTIERFSILSSAASVRLTYEDDITKVTTEIRPEVERVAVRLNKNPQLHALIEGHADNIGGAKYNQGLSEKRAAAAKKQLIDLGVHPRRITTRGWGEARPLNANSTKEERHANRRIEILLVPE